MYFQLNLTHPSVSRMFLFATRLSSIESQSKKVVDGVVVVVGLVVVIIIGHRNLT